MSYRIWFALALVFFGLAIGYMAWWIWTAVPPAPPGALREASGTLATVEDVSRSADPVHPVLELVIATGDGGRRGVIIRNSAVSLGQFRAMIGDSVRARYAGDTRVAYEFFTGDRRVIGYDASYRQELESYNTLKDAAKLAGALAMVFLAAGGLMMFRNRKRS